MEQNQGKIGIKEYMAIVIFAIGTKISDDTPAILYNSLSNAAWMSPIIIGILSFIPIYLLIKVMTTYSDKNLLDVIHHLFGKYLAFILVLSMLILGFIAMVIDSAIYVDIIGTMYFTKTPTLVIYIVLMLVSSYGGKKGLEHIGSVSWAVFPYLQISIFLVFILTFSHGETAYLFPLFGPGIWEVFKESSMKLSIFTDILYLALIASSVKSKKDYKKGTWMAVAIVIFELSLALVVYVVLFDYLSVEMLNYPYHETIRYLSLGFLTNIETFFLPYWLIATFVRFSIYLYFLGMMFGWLFKISNFEYTIPSIATIIVFIGIIPETPTFTIFNYRETILNMATPTFFLLPCLFWIVAKFKGAFKNANNSSKIH